MKKITLILILALPLFASAHISGMGMVAAEVNQMMGETFSQAILLENAEIVSESTYNISVRTSTNALTFNISSSVVYSELVNSPLVAYGKRKTVLLMPKQ